ncbi:MAG: hypothetical protein ABW022_02735 [Actinoplanes sp.]
MVVARAVIVYQERPRRPWRLWVFTAVLVSLTIGVILGQTVAFEPNYRPTTANAETAAVPPAVVPSAGPPSPAPVQRVSAPLGSVRSRQLEVTGASTVLRVRSADLGDRLFDIVPLDGSAVPRVTDVQQGSRLELVPTGVPGTIGAEIQLNAKVAWKLKLAGGAAEQTVDLQAGGAAGVEIAGGSARVALSLPVPKGTVPLALKGPIGDLAILTKPGNPVRLRLGAGAESAVVDGNTRRQVKAGTTLTPEGWRTAKNRYDLTSSGTVTSVQVS